MAQEIDAYACLEFPPVPGDRPYCYINMVTTIDGKTLSGSRDDHVLDLGSKNDHILMKRIERSADAVMIGAQTLRASPKAWLPAPRTRLVVSQSGNLPYDARFLEGDHAFVITSQDPAFHPEPGVKLMEAGKDRVEFGPIFSRLRHELRIERLLVLGGSELNAQLLAANLVDELFITIAPKVKLGRDVPTYAGGNALPRESLQSYNLIEHHAIGDEVFIRYRRT